MNRIKKINNNTIIIFNEDQTVDIYSYESHIIKVLYEDGSRPLQVLAYEDWDHSTTTSRGRNQAFEYLGFKELATTTQLKNSKIVTFIK